MSGTGTRAAAPGLPFQEAEIRRPLEHRANIGPEPIGIRVPNSLQTLRRALDAPLGEERVPGVGGDPGEQVRRPCPPVGRERSPILTTQGGHERRITDADSNSRIGNRATRPSVPLVLRYEL